MGFSVKQSEECPNCGKFNDYITDVFTIFDNRDPNVQNVQGTYFCFECEYECGFGGVITIGGEKNPHPKFLNL